MLRSGGECGIVVPSGIYTDLGAKQLREMFFAQTRVRGLFGFENRKDIFEGVDTRFKFVVLTFEKGGRTEDFPAAFMRHEVEELSRFPSEGSVKISVDLVRRLSPDSLSVIEFKSERDVQIAHKLSIHPMLCGDDKGWGLELYGEELNMTRSAESFLTKPTKSPLYEGAMIWQFDHQYSEPRYWVKEADIRQSFLEKRLKRTVGLDRLPKDLKPDYEVNRIAIRKIASNTNERTLISALVPPRSFAGNSLSVHFPFFHTKDGYNTLRFSGPESLVILAELNSFVLDYVLRARMTTNLNLFYLYQLPVPRLTAKDPAFAKIVSRAAKLVCTTPEFDDLAAEAGIGSHTKGVTDATLRAKLLAELDALVAHLYGVNEEEFAHILTAFPLVAHPVKDAALAAFRAFMPKPGDPQIASLLAAGESAKVEFKSSARWDLRENKKNPVMEQVILKTIAAFLNSDGGTLLLGVSDEGAALGLEHDYQTLQKKNADGYELFLTDLLLTHYGKDCSPCVGITFHPLEGKQVCRVIAQPAPRPVWVKEAAEEHLYIRSGNSTRRLSTREALDYCKTRWKQ